MSHINRTRPRQGLQLVIRRVAGSQISHIFQRASAGSEALPSLAHRVSMQQHAELTCRGNKIGNSGKHCVKGITTWKTKTGDISEKNPRPGIADLDINLSGLGSAQTYDRTLVDRIGYACGAKV